ncbi:hypothetical protein OQH61_03190 [Helicobacter sp. MIT 21-1697]|nr:hypothetical protein [Helicobacter sp. MIT 21-1697]MCX2716737.1 hypothetical protein [Helicobacter sp. MIT 21-1697]
MIGICVSILAALTLLASVIMIVTMLDNATKKTRIMILKMLEKNKICS